MALVVIDAGNSRIKWGVQANGAWQAQGAVDTAQVAALAAVAAAWPADARVVLCNVAGPAVRAAIVDVLPSSGDLRAFLPAAECCGVHNGYDAPDQWGADRWAALVGARAACTAACLVVCAGTATTIDVLAADGGFRGGVILPGFDLMRMALANNTAQLPLADGRFQPVPTTTVDAIVSGCLQAQVGAIGRLFAAIADEPGARCLLTGGGAPRLLPALDIPVTLSENLILDGLARYGNSL